MHAVPEATVFVLLRTDAQRGIRSGKATGGARSVWIFDLVLASVLDFDFDLDLGHALVEPESKKERLAWRAVEATKTPTYGWQYQGGMVVQRLVVKIIQHDR